MLFKNITILRGEICMLNRVKSLIILVMLKLIMARAMTDGF